MFRYGRVTASRVKDICSVKKLTNISLIKTKCCSVENNLKVAATDWGIKHENDGLIINPNFPHTAASTLEMKCPYNLTQGINIAGLNFMNNGKLITHHKYFYQIQTQMLLYGVNYGDFVIWSPQENLHLERISIDSELCNKIIDKSKWVFQEALLPELLGKFFSNKTNIYVTNTQISFE